MLIPLSIAAIMVAIACGLMRLSDGTDQFLIFAAMAYCVFGGVFLGLASLHVVKPQRRVRVPVAIGIITSVVGAMLLWLQIP